MGKPRHPTRLSINPAKTYLATCAQQKVGYKTKAEALDAAEWIMEQGHVQPGCHITPYVCDRCGYWHVYNRHIHFAPLEQVS